MADETRSFGLLRWLAVILFLAPLVGVGWWLTHPAAPRLTVDPREELDVICTGRVDAAGLVTALEPSQPGRVVKLCAAENQMLEKGQEILRLDDAAASFRVAQAKAGVEGANLDLASAKNDAERFPKQLDARKAMANATKARVEQARKLVEQRKAQQTVTPLTKIEQEGLEAQVRELEAIELADRLQLEDIEKNVNPQWRVDGAKARFEAATAELRLAQYQLGECVLKAPVAGRVLRLQTSVGAILSPGGFGSAVVFMPAGPLVVRAELDQEFLGRVREGQLVEIQDDGRADGPILRGKVKSMARWVATRRSLVLDPGEINDVRTLECVIELEKPGDDLYVGQRMRVRIKAKSIQ